MSKEDEWMQSADVRFNVHTYFVFNVFYILSLSRPLALGFILHIQFHIFCILLMKIPRLSKE